MSEPRDDRRVVIGYRSVPRSPSGWLRDTGAAAGERVGTAAARLRGIRLRRGWWIGPTGVAMLGLAGWAAFVGPASVGTRPPGLGPMPAEGSGIDLSTGVPPEVAFGPREAEDDDRAATERSGPLVVDLRAAAEEEAARAGAGIPEIAVEEDASNEIAEAGPEPVKTAAEAVGVEPEPAMASVEMAVEAAPPDDAEAVSVAAPLRIEGDAQAAEPAPAAEPAAEVPEMLAMADAGDAIALESPEPSWTWTSAVAVAASARDEATPAGGSAAATEAEMVALARPVPPPVPTESRTQRVVYMVDLSGSLVDSLPEAVRWIGEALDKLDQPAVFTVLFFRQGEIIEAPPYGLKPATFAMKWEAYDWMRPEKGHVEAGGKATLSDAVLAALRYEVDRVVLLSDDGFGRGLSWVGGPTLLDEIAMTLPNAGTRIDTVQFFYRDPAGAMEAIADRFGGEYAFIARALPDDEPAFVDLYGKLRTR